MPLIENDKIDSYIQNYVALLLSEVSGYELGYISGEQDLKQDLGIPHREKIMLVTRFQEIINNLGGRKNVREGECRRLIKVSDCSALIRSYLDQDVKKL